MEIDSYNLGIFNNMKTDLNSFRLLDMIIFNCFNAKAA